jgi:hypothetical protein
MKLHANPLSRSYAKYLLRVGNGQKSSIIDHFPPEANAEPLVGVKIVLYPEIYQPPSLNTLIHVVFSALTINYTNQGYMDGRAILTIKNIIVNFLNTQIVEVVPRWKHVFLSANSMEMGDDQAMAIGTKFLNTVTLEVCHHINYPQSWRPCYLTEKSQCDLKTL